MFIATFGIAVSLTMTCVYLIFYSVSTKLNAILDIFDYLGKLVMVFGFTFAFLGTELKDSYIYFPLMFALVCTLLLNLILLQYSWGRIATLWITIGVLSFAFVYDFTNHSTPKQKRVFFIPMFVEALVLLLGYCLYAN